MTIPYQVCKSLGHLASEWDVAGLAGAHLMTSFSDMIGQAYSRQFLC